MKETAVEWLIKQIKEDQTIKAKSMDEWNTVFHKSIAMEWKQIIDACNQTEFEDIDGMGIHETITKGEEYYNQTFKSEQNES